MERIAAWHQARFDAADLPVGVVPGAVMAIARGDKLAYLKAIGFQDRAKTVPMKTDSIFWIGSMTKPVTSAAAMVLFDEGKLNLDAPVAQYLPDLANMQVGVEKTDPLTGKTEIALEPPKRPMTVRDLLRHTSGLVYPPQYVHAPINKLYNKAVFQRDKTLADFVASLGALPLAHQPGEVWEYSWGVDVLARVVEVASGQPFDEFERSHIFEPLRMVDTGFYVPDAKRDRLVDPAEVPRPALWDFTKQPRLFSGGGGLVSTAADYLRFCQMLLNGGELDGARILKPETVRLMTTDSLPSGVSFVQDAVGPLAGSSWGLGFALRTNANFSAAAGSVGSFYWTGVWGTYFWVDPAEKLIAIEMIQATPGNSAPYRDAFRHLVYGALKVPEPPDWTPSSTFTPLSADALASYVGKYDFGPSTSSRDVQGVHIGVGVDFSPVDGGVRIDKTFAGTPAAKAGLLVGDIVTRLDGAPLAGVAPDQVRAKFAGAEGAEMRLQIRRAGQEQPIDFTIARKTYRRPGIVLEVSAEDGRLAIESAGPWPILDFDVGRPTAVAARSNDEFYVDGPDHTRIVFVKDAAGKVTGAVLNPGPWEQRGAKLD